jgi:hypothetical protein
LTTIALNCLLPMFVVPPEEFNSALVSGLDSMRHVSHSNIPQLASNGDASNATDL